MSSDAGRRSRDEIAVAHAPCGLGDERYADGIEQLTDADGACATLLRANLHGVPSDRLTKERVQRLVQGFLD